MTYQFIDFIACFRVPEDDTAVLTAGHLDPILIPERGADGHTAARPQRVAVAVGGDADLLIEQVAVGATTWVDGPVDGPVLVQCSAHGATRSARIGAIVDGWLEVGWREPQRRVAPGQSVVFYDGDTVLGGGTIEGGPGLRAVPDRC